MLTCNQPAESEEQQHQNERAEQDGDYVQTDSIGLARVLGEAGQLEESIQDEEAYENEAKRETPG